MKDLKFFCPVCGFQPLGIVSDWTPDDFEDYDEDDPSETKFDVGVHCHSCRWRGRIVDDPI